VRPTAVVRTAMFVRVAVGVERSERLGQPPPPRASDPNPWELGVLLERGEDHNRQRLGRQRSICGGQAVWLSMGVALLLGQARAVHSSSARLVACKACGSGVMNPKSVHIQAACIYKWLATSSMPAGPGRGWGDFTQRQHDHHEATNRARAQSLG